jgi:hypothetical protein
MQPIKRNANCPTLGPCTVSVAFTVLYLVLVMQIVGNALDMRLRTSNDGQNASNGCERVAYSIEAWHRINERFCFWYVKWIKHRVQMLLGILAARGVPLLAHHLDSTEQSPAKKDGVQCRYRQSILRRRARSVPDQLCEAAPSIR